MHNNTKILVIIVSILIILGIFVGLAYFFTGNNGQNAPTTGNQVKTEKQILVENTSSDAVSNNDDPSVRAIIESMSGKKTDSKNTAAEREELIKAMTAH